MICERNTYECNKPYKCEFYTVAERVIFDRSGAKAVPKAAALSFNTLVMLAKYQYSTFYLFELSKIIKMSYVMHVFYVMALQTYFKIFVL